MTCCERTVNTGDGDVTVWPVDFPVTSEGVGGVTGAVWVGDAGACAAVSATCVLAAVIAAAAATHAVARAGVTRGSCASCAGSAAARSPTV